MNENNKNENTIIGKTKELTGRDEESEQKGERDRIGKSKEEGMVAGCGVGEERRRRNATEKKEKSEEVDERAEK